MKTGLICWTPEEQVGHWGLSRAGRESPHAVPACGDLGGHWIWGTVSPNCEVRVKRGGRELERGDTVFRVLLDPLTQCVFSVRLC